ICKFQTKRPRRAINCHSTNFKIGFRSPLLFFGVFFMSTELAAPLTQLSEDEEMFRATVRDFAEEQIRPKVSQMDHDAKMDPGLIQQFFELGLMGIEIPEKFGGTGSTFFTSILIVEELSRVDASCGVLVDVQNTLVINAIKRWGNEDQQARYFPKLAKDTVGAYALSEANSGSDAFALQC